MADAPSAYPVASERDILIAARKLIERPEAWTQCVHALNKEGHAVPQYSAKAVCWCVQGAITRAAAKEDIQVAVRARNRFRAVIGCLSIPRWNDAPERTHADVLEAFDRAVSDA